MLCLQQPSQHGPPPKQHGLDTNLRQVWHSGVGCYGGGGELQGRGLTAHGIATHARRLKAEHLKKRGDEAFKESNYRQAWERCVGVFGGLRLDLQTLRTSRSKLAACHRRYTEALELHPDKAALHLLHANRSAAYCQGGRLEDALAAGDAAARLSPQWAKGHWRRGAALLALRRHPEAALAYQQAWRLSKGGSVGLCPSPRGSMGAALEKLTTSYNSTAASGPATCLQARAGASAGPGSGRWCSA